MKVKIVKSDTAGKISVPGSKSHTIRAIYIASLADRISIIEKPLLSEDAKAAIQACRAFGADIQVQDNRITVKGTAGQPRTPEKEIDVKNSGTTLRLGLGTAALCKGKTKLIGDEQINSRPQKPLMEALNNLGASVRSLEKEGYTPIEIEGRAIGGKTDLKSITSQYLTSLLINAPLFENDTEINVTELNEKTYIDITLSWLDFQGTQYETDQDYKRFKIQGRQLYHGFKKTIPGDFSSASFFLALGALSERGVTIDNLDMLDTQGDRRVVQILKDMGAHVQINGNAVKVQKCDLKGMELNLNDIPDALPIMSVLACFAEGETKLLNVPQARLKETDRIKTMASELSKMGANVQELKDGLIIKQSILKGCEVSGYSDHRIVMALTIAGLKIEGETIIDTAESVKITFPHFFDLIKLCQGKVEII